MPKTKTCNNCEETKLTGDFNKHRHQSDGLQRECRACQRTRYQAKKEHLLALQKEWVQNNRAARNQNVKRYKQRNPKKVSRWNREYRDRHPEIGKKNLERYYERHPEREKANRIVRKAVQTGKLKKSPGCERCGELREPRELDGHHPDYNDPLWVIWVDRQCHVDIHKEERGETPRTKAAHWFKLPNQVL